ncbi:MAG: GIY-YIG nuclease family protein [Betaproteobacteria bacterium]
MHATEEFPAGDSSVNGDVDEDAAAGSWILYLLECENGSYYAGITTDIERRFAEHVFGIGARYTRSNPPQRVLAIKVFPDRSSASRAEAALKKRPRGEKISFFSEQPVA